MKKIIISILLFVSSSLFAGLTSCVITPSSDAQGVFYSVEAWGLTQDGTTKVFQFRTTDEKSLIENIINSPSFPHSGTLYRSTMIWDGSSFNRIDFSTSENPSAIPPFTSWSDSDVSAISSLKSNIESR